MANIKVFALGGLGENGKNMYIVEVDEHIFILDAGLKYPDIDMYGVDAVIADMTYLVENKDRIEGVFVSHGHEDHINALPYLLKQIPTRIYGTHFTISLIENLLSDNKMNIKHFKLFRINENKVLGFGDVSVSFFNTSHSIPESVGIAIHTKDGSIVYCTDFNFGPTNYGKYQTSFDKIIDLSKKKVLALLTESIGSGAIDRIKNDSLLEHSYKNILLNMKGRIIISAYSSDLSRIQKVVNLSIEMGKKIAMIGRKSEKIVDVAITSNYLAIPADKFVRLEPMTDEKLQNLDNDLVVIVTGVRNEPYSLLVRMALGEDKFIKLMPTDTVIMMCPPVPGTEKYAINSLNTLYRYDTNIVIFDKKILRSSHANKEDLKLLYSMLKPAYIIPIKGEYRHMYEQYLVAKDAGYKDEQIILLENGEIIHFIHGEKGNRDKVYTGDIFVDGSLLGNVNEEIIHDREILAEEGVIILTVNYDSRLRKVISVPSSITKGFSYKLDYNELDKKIAELLTRMVNNSLVKKRFSTEETSKIAEEKVAKLVMRLTKHRPVVICTLIDVNK